MKHSLLFILSLILLAGAATAQQSPFDVDAYKTFLATHTDISAAELQAMYPAGSFAEGVAARFSDAGYSDSIGVRYALTDYERSLLDRHGFMVTERLAPNSFGDGLLDVYKKKLPVFISTDAILHALHMSYDLILMDVESAVLVPKLDALLAELHTALPVLEARYAAEPDMRTPLRDLDVYLTVPRTLLAGAAVAPLWPENQATVDELLDLIDAEQAVAYPLFAETCRLVDFSQFTPRGHYTQRSELMRYFQAMIWLGRTELYLIGPETAQCKPADADVQRQTIDAALMVEAAEVGGGEALLQEIDEIIGFFVGESDNVTLPNLQAVLAAAQVEQASGLLDEDRWRAFQDVLADQAFAFQNINSQILISGDISDPDAARPASAFMLLGQRFVIDSYITGHTVFDEVIPGPGQLPRMLPATQDVLFALGNDASAQLLEEELDEFGYAPNLAALRYLVDAYEPEFWNSTLYNGWLDAVRSLNPPEERVSLPAFAQTAAWWQQKMNTQLASWAQLRHDNLLYAKQSYSSGIDSAPTPQTVEPAPAFFVEPFPAFFEAVHRFARRAAEQFEAVDVGQGTSDVIAYFRTLEAVSDTLHTIAQKERHTTPLDDAERQFLERMITHELEGEDLQGWYARLFYGTERVLDKDLVVADIHTAVTDAFGSRVGWVLHVGTGPVNMAVVTAEVPGEGLTAFVGPVMSYYEHLSINFKRLTDEKWQTAHAEDPSYRPDFVNLYLADHNGESRGGGATLAMQGTGVGTAVSDTPGVPRAIQLAPNYPNPFNASTVIGYTVTSSQAYERVELAIYDVQGRRIRHLFSQKLPAGRYTIQWDGSLDAGGQAASGVYFLRLQIGDQQATRPITLVR